MTSLPLVAPSTEAEAIAWRSALTRAGLPADALRAGALSRADAAGSRIVGKLETLQSLAGEDGLSLDGLVAAIDHRRWWQKIGKDSRTDAEEVSRGLAGMYVVSLTRRFETLRSYLAEVKTAALSPDQIPDRQWTRYVALELDLMAQDADGLLGRERRMLGYLGGTSSIVELREATGTFMESLGEMAVVLDAADAHLRELSTVNILDADERTLKIRDELRGLRKSYETLLDLGRMFLPKPS